MAAPRVGFWRPPAVGGNGPLGAAGLPEAPGVPPAPVVGTVPEAPGS